jgi:nitrite reductase/ring-hydroxylating ferredoxin subunit
MNFQPIARSEELEEGKGRPYALAGHRLALVRHRGLVYALEDRCPHADASIACGPVENGAIACPWHYAEFDLASGAVLSGPAACGIPVFPVREEDGIVSVALDAADPSKDN